MFGEKIDYLLLKPFSHTRNIATEAQLNALAQEGKIFDIKNAVARLQKLIHRLDDHFPIRSNLRYLDIGCGNGELTLALALKGCGDITGIDLVPRHIEQANWNASNLHLSDHVTFICQDIHLYLPTHKYDVILSHEALEHIQQPEKFLRIISNVLTTDGIVILAFGPLFYSPFGDHMSSFFSVSLPWRGSLFSEKAILRLRRECFRPTDFATQYQDISGGLNLMRYSDFIKYAADAGWEFEFLEVNPQLKRIPLLYKLSNILIRIPRVRDYVASSVYVILRRKALHENTNLAVPEAK